METGGTLKPRLLQRGQNLAGSSFVEGAARPGILLPLTQLRVDKTPYLEGPNDALGHPARPHFC